MSKSDVTKQCLFLLDEPDVHLNEHWNVRFVKILKEMTAVTPYANISQEVIVSTHSSMILTDAAPNQLYYFKREKEGVECINIQASTFGASRNQISQDIFQLGSSVGEFAHEKIKAIIQNATSSSELKKYLDIVGPGYLRFRMYDKYYWLIDREKNERDD